MAFLDIPVALSLGSEMLRDLVQARDYAGPRRDPAYSICSGGG
jgi:hypothetical protein